MSIPTDHDLVIGAREDRLPLAALLALAMAGFITILTEALPAGLLPQMSAALDISQSAVGQLVTVYAIGSLVAAIPLTAATQRFRRKPLLLCAIAGFAMANTVTAITESYAIMLVARFFAGVSAGLLWALIAGYAARMVPERLRGRAIAIAMVGTPLALSLGIPAGTMIGAAVGWRSTFAVMSMLTLVLICWAWMKVPDFPGNTRTESATIAGTLTIGGIKPILTVTLLFVLAHNILYTYIAPLTEPAGLGLQLDLVLLTFGISAIFGIIAVGYLISRWLRALVLTNTVIFIIAAGMLGVWGDVPEVLWLATAMWGLAFGGVATLFQTAAANTAKKASDVAQSLVVTAWNLAIAVGGIVGALLLDYAGTGSLAWSAFALLTLAYAVAMTKNRGFR